MDDAMKVINRLLDKIDSLESKLSINDAEFCRLEVNLAKQNVYVGNLKTALKRHDADNSLLR